MTGTWINILTVIVGSLVGTFLGNRLPDKMRQTVVHGLGLMTAVVGMQMALGTGSVLLVMGSILVGGVVGEWWRIDDRLEAMGRWLEAQVAARAYPRSGARTAATAGNQGERSITRAFVTASLVFCVGPMTVLGSIQDGLTGDYSLLAIKSMLDGFAALAFAASMGPGVILSTLTIFFFQGALSLAAMGFGGLLGEVTRQTPWVIEMTAAGGVLMLAISLLLLELRQIRVANLLPAVFIAPLAQIGLELVG
ncbi:MAG: DUF554 domain-containing protein [Anaerolineae bacterium]|nr:DUF554 domain-containing protein [Anaerolineae bacterium]